MCEQRFACPRDRRIQNFWRRFATFRQVEREEKEQTEQVDRHDREVTAKERNDRIDVTDHFVQLRPYDCRNQTTRHYIRNRLGLERIGRCVGRGKAVEALRRHIDTRDIGPQEEQREVREIEASRRNHRAQHPRKSTEHEPKLTAIALH